MSNTSLASGVIKTWEPTVNLRWGTRFVPFKGSDTIAVATPELQQLWRCIQTHEEEWSPIEVQS